ncbi:aminoglycoside 6-adenylyltransferase [Candidatus Dependentiae bacterium]
MNQKVIDKIIDWAKGQEPVKVLILTGSFAGKGPTLRDESIDSPQGDRVDELSDYDIAIFTDDIEKYADDDSWIHKIEDVVVYEPCQLYKNNKEYPTRLVIYKDGLQVDFSLFDLDYLKYLTLLDKLPVDYNLGYKILLDKDDVTKNLKSPTYEYPFTKKPSKEAFELAISIFFFEAFKEAKALVRNDLWHAKIRDWTTKEYLLRMIEWHEKAKHGWNYDTNCDGKRMQSWVDPSIWQKGHNIFAHFDKEDSFAALIPMINLFRELATEVAKILNYEYPNDVDEKVTKLINGLKKGYR